MKGLPVSLLCVVFACAPSWAEDSADTNLQILLDKIHADKKLLVAANMNLTEADGKVFWPVYDSYQKDLQGINERVAKVIDSYADAWNGNTLTDETAKSLLTEAMAIEESELQLRKKYASQLSGVLPAKLVARYMQIESKIRAAMRYELAEAIPLVQ